MKVRVEGQLVFNSSPLILEATLAGFGVAYLPEDMVISHLQRGRLKRVLEDWCPPFTGYHLYYSKPPPILTCLLAAGGCAASQGLMSDRAHLAPGMRRVTHIWNTLVHNSNR